MHITIKTITILLMSISIVFWFPGYGLSQPDEDKIEEIIRVDRSPYVGGAWSLAFPGVGQFYNEDIIKGGVFLGSGALTLGAAILTFYLGELVFNDDYLNATTAGDAERFFQEASNYKLTSAIIFALAGGIWVYNMVDAVLGSIDYNRETERLAFEQLKKASMMGEKGNWNASTIISTNLINNFPLGIWTDDAYFSLGLSYENQEQYSEAVDTYAKVTETFPDSDLSDDALFRRGLVSEAQGSYEGAYISYNELLNGYSGSEWVGRAQFRIAGLQERDELYQEATESYRKVILYSQEHGDGDGLIPRAQYKIGHISYVLNRYQEAITGLKEFIDLFPDHELNDEARLEIGDSYYYWGDDFYRKGDYVKTLEILGTFLSLYPDHQMVDAASDEIADSYYLLGEDHYTRL